MKTLRRAAILLCALWIGLPTICLATEWLYAVDENPRRAGPDMWRFSIKLGVKPIGQLLFAWSQYDFASATQGIEVDYDFNGRGIDFSDDRRFYAIAPTLFESIDGFFAGWDVADMNDGVFRGVVYSTAPLTRVHFIIEAESFMPVHHRQRDRFQRPRGKALVRGAHLLDEQCLLAILPADGVSAAVREEA